MSGRDSRVSSRNGSSGLHGPGSNPSRGSYFGMSGSGGSTLANSRPPSRSLLQPPYGLPLPLSSRPAPSVAGTYLSPTQARAIAQQTIPTTAYVTPELSRPNADPTQSTSASRYAEAPASLTSRSTTFSEAPMTARDTARPSYTVSGRGTVPASDTMRDRQGRPTHTHRSFPASSSRLAGPSRPQQLSTRQVTALLPDLVNPQVSLEAAMARLDRPANWIVNGKLREDSSFVKNMGSGNRDQLRYALMQRHGDLHPRSSSFVSISGMGRPTI